MYWPTFEMQLGFYSVVYWHEHGVVYTGTMAHDENTSARWCIGDMIMSEWAPNTRQLDSKHCILASEWEIEPRFFTRISWKFLDYHAFEITITPPLTHSSRVSKWADGVWLLYTLSMETIRKELTKLSKNYIQQRIKYFRKSQIFRFVDDL